MVAVYSASFKSRQSTSWTDTCTWCRNAFWKDIFIARVFSNVFL